MTPTLTEWQFWTRVIRMAAAIIGAAAALWLLSGDRDPEAAQYRDVPDHGYTASAVVNEYPTVGPRDIGFFELVLDPDGTGIVVSSDNDLAISKWLHEHRGQKIQLVLRAAMPLSRDGNR